MSRNEVIFEDLGLGSLAEDARRLCEEALESAARAVEKKMKLNIIAREYTDTRATLNSVQVEQPGPLTRDIGPTTEYALLGELGWVQTHVRIPPDPKQPAKALQRLKEPIHHPGLHFARDALNSVRGSLVRALEAAFEQLGER